MLREKLDFVDVNRTVFYDDQRSVDKQFPGLRRALKGVANQIQKVGPYAQVRPAGFDVSENQFRVKPYQRTIFVQNLRD